MDESDFIKRLALQVPGNPQPLSFLSWSAGQREFTPMLMGLYWLCSLASTRRAESVCAHAVEWVVSEEPEMGLHPKGIEVVLLLVLDLLRRGYRVVLSTHSPVVLELVWALQEFKKLNASESSVRRVFGLPSVPVAKELASTALAKDLRVYFFDRQGSVSDISALDPGCRASSRSGVGRSCRVIFAGSHGNREGGQRTPRSDTQTPRRAIEAKLLLAGGLAFIPEAAPGNGIS
jgi:hypothetical protein